MAEIITDPKQFPAWMQPNPNQAVPEIINCESTCPRIQSAEGIYAHELNLGYYNNQNTSFISRNLEAEALNRINRVKRDAQRCLGAIITGEEVVCRFDYAPKYPHLKTEENK